MTEEGLDFSGDVRLKDVRLCGLGEDFIRDIQSGPRRIRGVQRVLHGGRERGRKGISAGRTACPQA